MKLMYENIWQTLTVNDYEKIDSEPIRMYGTIGKSVFGYHTTNPDTIITNDIVVKAQHNQYYVITTRNIQNDNYSTYCPLFVTESKNILHRFEANAFCKTDIRTISGIPITKEQFELAWRRTFDLNHLRDSCVSTSTALVHNIVTNQIVTAYALRQLKIEEIHQQMSAANRLCKFLDDKTCQHMGDGWLNQRELEQVLNNNCIISVPIKHEQTSHQICLQKTTNNSLMFGDNTCYKQIDDIKSLYKTLFANANKIYVFGGGRYE